MPEQKLIEGTVVDFDPEPKPAGKWGNWRLGVRIKTAAGTDWYSYWEREEVKAREFHAKLARGAVIKALGEKSESSDRWNLKQVFSVAPPPGAPPGPGVEAPPPREDPRVAIKEAMRDALADAVEVLHPHIGLLKEQYPVELGLTARTLFIERRRAR